jgi:hypothetical protein
VRFGELLGASSRSHPAYIVNYRCHNAVSHNLCLRGSTPSTAVASAPNTCRYLNHFHFAVVAQIIDPERLTAPPAVLSSCACPPTISKLYSMGGGNAMKSKTARDKKLAADKKAGKGSQLKTNSNAMTIICAICRQTFMCNSKKITLMQHVESKHSKLTFDGCFPGFTE